MRGAACWRRRRLRGTTGQARGHSAGLGQGSAGLVPRCEPPGPAPAAACAACSAPPATTPTRPLPYPLPPPPLAAAPAGEFTHAFTALRTILAREGRRGIFAGYGSFLLRDLPFDAIEFWAYEMSKKG